MLAAGGDGEAAERALESVCRIFWQPVFRLVLAQGFAVPDAEDLTQEFFGRLVARELLRHSGPGKGRLRALLAVALRNFLTNARAHAAARKRGGGWRRLDGHLADCEAELPPATALSPDRQFDRQWALALLERVLGQLADEYARAGRADVFAALRSAISADAVAPPAAELARRLQLTEGAVRVAAHRLRQRYREL